MCLTGCSQGSHTQSGLLPWSWLCFPLTDLFNPQLENAAKKRERATSDPRTTEQKQEKKRLKISKKPKDPDPPEKDFTPYDYSKLDFKAFAGEARREGSGELLAPVQLHGRGAHSPQKEGGLLPQGPCWTKPISYPAWAGGSALRAGQGTMGKWMWTNQFPNDFPLLPPPTRRGKRRGQRGKGVLGPELQLPLRRESGLQPSSLHLQPAPRSSSGSRLEAG